MTVAADRVLPIMFHDFGSNLGPKHFLRKDFVLKMQQIEYFIGNGKNQRCYKRRVNKLGHV